MKKLSKLKLNDVKVLNVNEMKSIIGGQVISKGCANIGTSTGINGDVDDVVCSGECPTIGDVTGTGKPPVKQTCQKHGFSSNGNTIVACICK